MMKKDYRHVKIIFLIISGGDSGERRRGEVEHDPAILPRNIHQNIQEDDRKG